MNRNQDPVINTLKHIKNTKPTLSYTNNDIANWQATSRQKLNELLGIQMLEKCDENLIIDYDRINDNCREIRFTFQSEPGYYIPCHLLIPKDATHPLPVVICLQGHTNGMHISLARPKYKGDDIDIASGDRDFATDVLKKGFCALAIEQRGMGECGGSPNGPACHVHTMANLLIGRTTIGERVWDIMRAIDVLEKHFPQIDKEKIICLGNSGGGTTTFYAACLDERITTAIPSCCFASYDDSIAAMFHCTCNFVPDIRKYFDMGDLSGLIAPRTLIMVSGEKDPIFPIESAKSQFEITKKAYSNIGGICTHVIGNEGHRFYSKTTWETYDKIQKNISSL